MTRAESSPFPELHSLRVNWDALAMLGIFFASFALYARTAYPGVLAADGGEFQTNIYRLGVSHTGYPLYFLLAKLWTLGMPVGTIAYRANVFSSLFGALTLVVLYAFIRTLTERRVVALLIAVLFGVSRVQWSQAIIPDVYTLNSFFIVLVLWLAILWRAKRAPLWSVALSYGFALTHHRTIIWLAPALAIFVLLDLRRELARPRELVQATTALLLPLLLYLYIPLRGDSDVGVEYHANGFMQMIFASNVSVWLRFGPPGFLWERITQVYLPLMLEQFTPIGFLFGLLGIGALVSNRMPRGFLFPEGKRENVPPRQLLLLLGLAHLAEAAFAIVFWVVDSEIFFIPSYLTFLFFVAIGLAITLDFLAVHIAQITPRRIAQGIFVVGIFAVCAFLVWTNFARNDHSQDDDADSRWQAILAQPLEQNALLIGPWEELTPYEYYKYVDNIRADLQREKVVIAKDQLALVSQGDIAAEIRHKLTQGQAVYLTHHPDDTETLTSLDQFELTPIASLWRVSLRRAVQGGDAVTFGDGDELHSLDISSTNPHAGDFVTLNANWADDAPLSSVRLVLRLFDGANNLWSEQESLPFGGREKSDAKNSRDSQGLFIPPDAPPGSYTLELAAYARGSQEPQAIVGDSNSVTHTVKVLSPASSPPIANLQIPHALSVPRNGAQFDGYGFFSDSNTLVTQMRGGDQIDFSSWWQGLGDGNGTLDITLHDANDNYNKLYNGALVPNSSANWNPAQIIRAHQTLTLPPIAPAGNAQLLLSYNGQPLPPLNIVLAPSNRQFTMPVVEHPQVTLVGDSLQMIAYKLDRTTFRAGDQLPLTLYWNANKTPGKSYKVFVHLLDANGVLRAQDDSIPQNGTLATNHWFPGEYITDAYSLTLPRDLPAGTYHLEVGMYDPATIVRVPLRKADGTPLPNDSLILDDSIQIQP